MSEEAREVPNESPVTVSDPQLKSQKAVDLRAQLEFQLQNKEKQSSPFALLKKKFARASSTHKRGPSYHPVASGARGSEDSEDIDAEFEASLTNRPSNPVIGAQLQRDGYVYGIHLHRHIHHAPSF
eukprot:TRINITY_DN13227_c0_g1_i1.p1 TRINITY_DN13227_c0_g1~~TRINITY_DN13227_c0_g1_i1.p1  ORF type:complete len:126 (-),score=18.49 TRINITY_DN13227_c0_g1_i1:23-400(-)